MKRKRSYSPISTWLVLFFLVVACTCVVIYTYTQLNVGLVGDIERAFVGVFLLLAVAVVIAILWLVNEEVKLIFKKSEALEKIVDYISTENDKLRELVPEEVLEDDDIIDESEEEEEIVSEKV